jgi:hypothetical protein
MKVSLWTALRWFLIVPVLMASTAVAGVLAILDTWRVEHRALVWASALHIDVPSSLILQAVLLLFFLMIAVVWVLPPTFALGYALRARPLRSLIWGCSATLLLTAFFAWSRASSDESFRSRWFALVAVVVLAAGIVLAYRNKRRNQTHLFGNAACLAVLFLAQASAILFSPPQPPLAQKVWSSVLQRVSWPDINTGSEYEATRHVVFAGDRVVAAFDAGPSGYENNSPISKFRIVSLDSATGAMKDSIEFKGKWGNTPYLYATEDGHVRATGTPTPILNADLSSAEVPDTSSYGVFGEQSDKVAAAKLNADRARAFAGMSRDGGRFALQQSDGIGDPRRLLYETFIVYDAKSLKPLVRVSMTDLPERQSWSAFSNDGKLFAAGSTNRLNLYRIP